MDQIRTIIRETIDYAIEFYEKLIKELNDNPLQDIKEKSPEELYALKALTSDTNSVVRRAAETLLKGEDPYKDPIIVTESLYNCEFDMETYKAVGYTDGQLALCIRLAHAIGDEELAKEACMWQYNCD